MKTVRFRLKDRDCIEAISCQDAVEGDIALYLHNADNSEYRPGTKKLVIPYRSLVWYTID
jgi:hypothetical protein